MIHNHIVNRRLINLNMHIEQVLQNGSVMQQYAALA